MIVQFKSKSFISLVCRYAFYFHSFGVKTHLTSKVIKPFKHIRKVGVLEGRCRGTE